MIDQVGADALDDDALDHEALDELTRLALAADPDVQLGPDAVALPEPGRGAFGELLPAWYMPVPATRLPERRRWRTAVVVLLVAALLVINALGFCITYGSLTLA